MTTIKVIDLPHSDDEILLGSLSQPLRRLRLDSLRNDAQCFLSKHNDEIDQPPAFWIDRLRGDQVDHWVAYDTNCQNDLSPYEKQLGGRMIAFLVVLPEENELAATLDPPSTITETFSSHSFGAVYVEPSHRGQGVSTMLMRAAINKLRNQRQKQDQTLIITLGVREHNTAALHIYKKLGFESYAQDVLENGSGEKDVFDLMRLELAPEEGQGIRDLCVAKAS